MKMFEDEKANELLHSLLAAKYKAIGEQVTPPARETFDDKKDWLIHLIAGQSGLSMAVMGNIMALKNALLIDEERSDVLMRAAVTLDQAILVSIKDSLEGVTSSKPAEGERTH